MNPAVTAGYTDNWMTAFVILELGRAEELAFPSHAIFNWIGQNFIGQLTDPGYNPFLVATYNTPFFKVNGTYFSSWADTKTGYNPGFTGWIGPRGPKAAETLA